MTLTTATPGPWFSGIALENQPAVGSAAGWPLVVYFHHVHPTLAHYTSLTPTDFRHGLELLLTEFKPLEPSDVEGAGTAEKSVLLTFDDGYADNADFALDVLAEFEVRAIFFQITGCIGQSLAGDPTASYLTDEDHERMIASGHRLGAHTVTHRRVSEISTADARREVGESAAWCRGADPDQRALFAYPYGVVREEVVADFDIGLSFGTVRSAALPWTDAPHSVRRTYLPSGASDRWPQLVRGWSRQWEG